MLLNIAAGMSEAEVAAILKEHDREMQEALRRLDQGRDKQAEQLRQKLAERRRNRMGDLRGNHATEVRSNKKANLSLLLNNKIIR